LHQLDFERSGFDWLDIEDWEKSIISFIRKARSPDNLIMSICNFTPVSRRNYRIGVPRGGYWKEILNSDAKEYGGSGQGNLGGVTAEAHPFHRRAYSVSITLPPFGALFFKSDT
jgi:1,4-alpha-glucan branching enzyme